MLKRSYLDRYKKNKLIYPEYTCQNISRGLILPIYSQNTGLNILS